MPDLSSSTYPIKNPEQFASLTRTARDAIHARRTNRPTVTSKDATDQYISCRIGLSESGRAFKRWYSEAQNPKQRLKRVPSVFWSFVYLALTEGSMSLDWLNEVLETLDLYIPNSRRDYLTKALSTYAALRSADCATTTFDSGTTQALNAVDQETLDKLIDHLTWKNTYIRRYDPGYDRLIGRDREVDLVIDLLCERNGFPFMLLEANGGWGKTAIAYQVMSSFIRHEVKNVPFTEYVWVSAKYEDLGTHGNTISITDAARTIDDVINQILARLGIIAAQSLTLPHKLQQLGERLRESSVLICLDNLETLGGALETLLKYLNEYCVDERRLTRFLLTSRPLLLDGFHVSKLDIVEMTEANSALLIHEHLVARHKPQRVPAADDMHTIYQQVGGVPLVLRQIAVQLEHRSVKTILANLRRSDLASDERTLYDHIFLATYTRLSEPAKALLEFVARSVSAEGATFDYLEEMCGLEFMEFDAGQRELSYYHLLEVRTLNDEERYTLHSLTRAWVRIVLLGIVG